jgi:hypothetical protein
MATSLGSMQAIFFIGLYFYIKNSTNPTSWALLPILFLSPFTFGTGLIIVICEVLEQSFRLYKRKVIYTKIKFTMLSIAMMCSVFLAQILPSVTKNYNFLVGGIPQSPVAGLIESLVHPVDSLKFILIMTGNIFVPSSRFDPFLPLIAGSIFLTICMFVMASITIRGTFNSVLENRNCVLAGSLFILLTLVARGVPSAQGFTAGTAPRYISGSFIFTVGMLTLLAERFSKVKKQSLVNAFFLSIIILVLLSGIKTGSEWLTVRNTQTKLLLNCLNSHASIANRKDGICFELAQPVRNPVTDEKFTIQLDNFSKEGYRE